MRLAAPAWLAAVVLATAALLVIIGPNDSFAAPGAAKTTQKPGNDKGEGDKSTSSGDDTDDYLDEKSDYSDEAPKTHHHHIHVHPKSSKTTTKPKPCDKGNSRSSFDDKMAEVQKLFGNSTDAPDDSSRSDDGDGGDSRSDDIGDSKSGDLESRSDDISESSTKTPAPAAGDSRASSPANDDDDDQDSTDDYSDEGEYRTTPKPGCQKSATTTVPIAIGRTNSTSTTMVPANVPVQHGNSTTTVMPIAGRNATTVMPVAGLNATTVMPTKVPNPANVTSTVAPMAIKVTTSTGAPIISTPLPLIAISSTPAPTTTPAPKIDHPLLNNATVVVSTRAPGKGKRRKHAITIKPLTTTIAPLDENDTDY